MSKLDRDKYYTAPNIVKRCLAELEYVLNLYDIKPTRWIEPSAGNGAFSSEIRDCIAYDIEPEADGIIKADYLNTDIEYMEGSIVVGNPPFGDRFNLALKFFKKSIKHSDVIAFILPIRQLNNNRVLYEFDLVKSIDLGVQIYSGRPIHCCFNIYKRPSDKQLNKKPSSKLKCVDIVRNDSKRFKNFDYDVRMCNWGNGSGGKLLGDDEECSGVYKIKIHPEFREKVIDSLKKADWHKETNNIAMLSIKQYHIIEYLKREVPNIY